MAWCERQSTQEWRKKSGPTLLSFQSRALMITVRDLNVNGVFQCWSL
jgi:hypothetical protein